MDYRFINTDYLDSVSGGDIEIVREIVEIFREQVGEMHTEMVSLYASHNFTALGSLAHKAKSSVAIMGMNGLAQMLKDFELQVKAGIDSEMYSSYISRFKDETCGALTELDDLLKNSIKQR